jgi:two-component system cell cycle response regulator
LQTFAARAKAIIRGTGTLCRLGGDEFVIIMPGTSLHTGFGIAEEIRAATASETFTLTPGGHEIPVTVSAGLAESANDSQSGLLRRADMALYRSKQGGRDRVCVDCAGAVVQARMAGCL